MCCQTPISGFFWILRWKWRAEGSFTEMTALLRPVAATPFRGGLIRMPTLDHLPIVTGILLLPGKASQPRVSVQVNAVCGH